jgi:hypothetical protein
MTTKLPKLHLIEDKLSRIWTNRHERAKYFGATAEAADQCSSDDQLLKAIDPRGVKLYSSLIDIGRLDLMSSIYPVVNELLGKQFETLVLDYFESMPPVHYNLNQSASRFSDYVLSCSKLIKRYPFLAELADYEWIELAVLEDAGPNCNYEPVPYLFETFQAPNQAEVDPERFASLIPVLNCVFVCRTYHYAIPQLVQDIKAAKKLPRRFKQEPTYVIVYRDPESLEARFLEVGEVSLMMLETIRQRPTISYGELLKDTCSKNPENVQNILTGCLEAIEQFKALNVIVAEKLPETSHS